MLGEDHPDTLQSINSLAVLFQTLGKSAEAEPYLREALEKSLRVLGQEHPTTLAFVNNVGGLLESQGKLAEAEAYYREALENPRDRRRRGHERAGEEVVGSFRHS